MELRLITFYAFLMCLQACINGHPIHRMSYDQLDWKTCKNKAIELNKLARDLSVYMNEPCKNLSAEFTDDLKIEARVCDPHSIIQNQHQCLQSITGVLQNFLSIFGKNELFQTNDAVVTKMVTDVNAVVAEILETLGGMKNEVMGTDVSKDPWQHCMLRKHSVLRLFSFSIISARVFSFAADPGMTAQSPNHC